MAAFTNPGGTPAAENERFEQEEVVIGAEGEEALVVGGATDAACALNKSSAGAARGSTLGRGHQGHPPRQAPATLQKATPLDDDGQDENGDQQHEGGADAEQEAAAQLLGPNGQPVAVLPNKLHDTLLVPVNNLVNHEMMHAAEEIQQDVMAMLAGISQTSGAAAHEKSAVDSELLRLQTLVQDFQRHIAALMAMPFSGLPPQPGMPF